ncbi:MAG: hypothetical protein JG765_1338 [Cereibacter sp.]|jgi:hypothetical protein|nr:hypothetical protein [Cereibacter sp.]
MVSAQQFITFQNVLAATSVVWYFTAVYYLELRRQFRFPEYPFASRYPLWRRRMKLYARLQAAAPDNVSDRGPEAQEVLLGSLRKVETRTAVLAALWGVVLVGLAALSLLQRNWQAGQLLMAALAVWSVPYAARLVLGISQIDQLETHKMMTRSSDDAAAAGLLQDQLIRDLFDKELAFRFSAFGFRALVVLLLALAVLRFAALGDLGALRW